MGLRLRLVLLKGRNQRLEINRVVALLVDGGHFPLESRICEAIVDQEICWRDDERLPGIPVMWQGCLQKDVQHAIRSAAIQIQIVCSCPAPSPIFELKQLIIQKRTNLLSHPQSTFVRTVRQRMPVIGVVIVLPGLRAQYSRSRLNYCFSRQQPRAWMALEEIDFLVFHYRLLARVVPCYSNASPRFMC
ncbi:hypothetical protein WN66_01933 [Saccharomyces cerevisiae]|nr:hypothetical protein WN66_01933 [Saccharomyces cerevisiae]